MRHLSVPSRVLDDVAIHSTSASSSTTVNHRMPPPISPWHSPVPYLFGGLAAMLGLIAFALLILACSYWRLSPSGEEDGPNGEEEKESRSGNTAENGGYDEKFIVIMAGDDLPRFLATPAMKMCTCGNHEGKMVISQENSVVQEVKENMREEKVKDTEEPTTSH